MYTKKKTNRRTKRRGFQSPEFVGAERREGEESCASEQPGGKNCFPVWWNRHRGVPDCRRLKRLCEERMRSPTMLVALRVRRVPKISRRERSRTLMIRPAAFNAHCRVLQLDAVQLTSACGGSIGAADTFSASDVVLVVQDRSSLMWTPRNSIHSSTVDGLSGFKSWDSPEIDNNLLGLLDVQEEVVIAAPHGQLADLLPVVGLIVVRDETNHGCVAHKLHNVVATEGSSCGSAAWRAGGWAHSLGGPPCSERWFWMCCCRPALPIVTRWGSPAAGGGPKWPLSAV